MAAAALVDRGQSVSQFQLSLFLFHKNCFNEPNYHEVWIILVLLQRFLEVI